MLYRTQNTLDSGQVLKEVTDINSNNIKIVGMCALMSGIRKIFTKL